MVKTAIVVFILVITYNTIFQFFTLRAEFLLKWRNQIYNCNAIVFSAIVMVSTREIILKIPILILDALKIEFIDALKVNMRLNTFKVVSISW